MILNIVDRRKNPYRWKCIDVIIEATWHDNAIPSADQASPDYREPSFGARKRLSLAEAIIWSQSFAVPLTLHLYDEGSVAVPEHWPPEQDSEDQ